MLELILVHDYALVHEQEQSFVRGREKSDRGREVGMDGEGSGDRGIEVGGEGEGSEDLVSPVHPLNYRTTTNKFGGS